MFWLRQNHVGGRPRILRPVFSGRVAAMVNQYEVRVRLTLREWLGFYRTRDKRCDCPGCG